MLEQIKDRWEGASEREQQLTVVSVVVIFVALLYFTLWQPLASNLADSQQNLKKAEQTLVWVEKSATKLVKAGVGHKKSKRKQNLSKLLSSTAKRNQIDISRIQNQDTKVDVWINQVQFTQFLNWTTTLQNKYGVQVISADLNRHKVQGTIKVNRLSFSY